MKNAYLIFPLLAAGLMAGCGAREEAAYKETSLLMSAPVVIKVYGAGQAEGAAVAAAILKELNRISDEFNYNDPYSMTSVVNKKAYGQWVKTDDEFMTMLTLAMDYYRLTGGAFDITFAPLWPIWKEAASTRKMPAKEQIDAALSNVGSGYIEMDPAARAVRFSKPVQLNMGGMLRGYCFVRAMQVLKSMDVKYPVELRLGVDMLAYGKRNWRYEVMDPFDEKKHFGSFEFPGGIIMSSSGREHFVQIEGKLYSHILDLKTGYPLKDFSNLVVYYPSMDSGSFLTSTCLAVMGRDKAFGLLGRMKGTAAVWLDGQGRETVFQNADSGAKWKRGGGLF